MSKKLSLILLVALVAGLLAACGGAATEAPTEIPPAETAAATEAPTAAPVTITIWHGYTETEEQLLSETVDAFMAANPDIVIETLAVPFDDLTNKVQTEIATGGGPTIVEDPQDRMAAYATAGLLAEIPADAPFWADLPASTIDGGKVAGMQVGVPINNKVLALFYNKSMVETPPTTWDELLAMAADGKELSLTADWFHNYMWLPAFGATLFDENYKVLLDSPEAAAAFAYYKTVCDSPGVHCEGNDGDADTLFRTGAAAFRIQGPWMSGDAIKDLGAENVGVAKIPTITDHGDPRPWNQSQMLMISINATEEQKAAALRFIAYMLSAEVQANFLNTANWIPANSTVDVTANPVVGGFLAQVPLSDPFPVVPELNATWGPMGEAVTAILDGSQTPEEALAAATTTINTTNKK